MSTTNLTCYMCNNPATSKEHAPPRALFPKDERFRKNLIKVPSCEKHNQELSNSDQILFQLLVVQHIIGNEPFKILSQQYLNKKSINYSRKINTLVNKIEKVTPVLLVNNVTGEHTQTGMIELNNSIRSFYSSLEKLGCALYFHEFKKKLIGNFFTHLDILVKKDEMVTNVQNLYNLSTQIMDQNKISFKGENPEVFQYRILETKNMSNVVIIEFLFYQNIRGIFKYTDS